MELKVVDCGIGWGAAHEEAQAKFVKLGGAFVAEIWVSENHEVKIRLPSNAVVTVDVGVNFPLTVTIPNPHG